MRKYVTALTLALTTLLATTGLMAQTYTGAYVDGSGVYRAPTAYKVMKDAAAWNPANLAFGNPSTVGPGNVPGAVLVTLANVTGASSATFHVNARDSAGNWKRLDLCYDASLNYLDAKVSTRATNNGVDTALTTSHGSGSWLTGGGSGGGGGTVDIFAVSTSVDARLVARHGSGMWDASGSVTVLPFQGSVSHETAGQWTDSHIVRGDSVSIPFSIGKDLTGWTVWFGAKANASDEGYAVPLRDITAYVTDPANGSGLINLSAQDTDVPPRRYQAELEIRNGQEINTPLRFYLWVDADVIR